MTGLALCKHFLLVSGSLSEALPGFPAGMPIIAYQYDNKAYFLRCVFLHFFHIPQSHGRGYCIFFSLSFRVNYGSKRESEHRAPVAGVQRGEKISLFFNHFFQIADDGHIHDVAVYFGGADAFMA